MRFPFFFPTGSIFFENTVTDTGETPTIYYVLSHRSGYWENLYYLLCASPLDGVMGEIPIIYYVLPHWIGLLGKSLLFTMCFPIINPGERIGEPSTI